MLGGTVHVTVQRYRRKTDSGRSIGCFIRGPHPFTVAAETHEHVVSAQPVPGFTGPTSYLGGSLYERISGSGSCSVYWVPPVTGYVLSVVLNVAATSSLTQCGRSFTSISHSLVAALSRRA